MRSRGWTRKGGVQRRRGDQKEHMEGECIVRERGAERARCSRQIISQPAESSRHVASPCWRRGVCEWVLHSISGTCTGALTCREKFCFEFLHFYSCWQFLASFIFSGCLLVSFPVLLWQLPSLCVSVCLLPAFVCFPPPVFPFCFSVPQVDSFELIWTFCGFPG